MWFYGISLSKGVVYGFNFTAGAVSYGKYSTLPCRIRIIKFRIGLINSVMLRLRHGTDLKPINFLTCHYIGQKLALYGTVYGFYIMAFVWIKTSAWNSYSCLHNSIMIMRVLQKICLSIFAWKNLQVYVMEKVSVDAITLPNAIYFVY